jgi:hypothetical protein
MILFSYRLSDTQHKHDQAIVSNSTDHASMLGLDYAPNMHIVLPDDNVDASTIESNLICESSKIDRLIQSTVKRTYDVLYELTIIQPNIEPLLDSCVPRLQYP